MRRLRADPFNVLRRHRGKVVGLAALALIVGLSIPFARLFAINPTESLPRGVYMKSSTPVAVGAVVEFRTPDAVRSHLAGQFDYLLKPIVAGPGDTVDTTSGEVVINSTVVPHSTILVQDSVGREVVAWRERRLLGADEFFVLSTRIPNSVDSRYFGPIRRSQIESVRRCVWAFE